MASLVYGGVPYALLALWATVWIDERPEAEIQRMMRRAPLLMIAAYAVFAVFLGARIASTENTAEDAVRIAGGVFGLGALAIIVLGYGYVALVIGLRSIALRWGLIDRSAISPVDAPEGAVSYRSVGDPGSERHPHS